MIGAHHDDIELGCGGTCYNYIMNGVQVFWLLCTRSEYKNISGTLQRSYEEATSETRDAMKILGVSDLIELSFEAAKLTHSYELITEIEIVIKKIKPDLIYTHWHSDIHQDHRAVSLATITAARRESSILMYQSNWFMSDQVFDGRIFSNIDSSFSKKVEAISCHKSELNKFGPGWLNFVEGRNLASGQVYGCRYAETFQLVKMAI